MTRSKETLAGIIDNDDEYRLREWLQRERLDRGSLKDAPKPTNRRGKRGRFNPIDGSLGMRGIGRNRANG